MLSKCANPECDQELRYLRAGKVFKVESGNETPFVVNGSKPVRRVEHFWLCGDCAEKLTLLYENGAISVVRKQVLPFRRTMVAAAS